MDVEKELNEAHARLPVNLADTPMPLDINLRSIALAIAQRHCGDTVVQEGGLYQQLKMDNKLAGPLTSQHVIDVALLFERYLWGEWSKSIAEKAMVDVFEEVDQALKYKLEESHPPIRPHSGGTDQGK